MHSSPKDPTNSVGDWFAARTYQATRPQDWTPEANLYLDYRQHATAAGIKLRDQLGSRAFAVEIRALCRREPQKRLARQGGHATAQQHPFWPRVLRSARLLASAA